MGRIEVFSLPWSAGQSVTAVVTAVCALHTQWMLQGTWRKGRRKLGSGDKELKFVGIQHSLALSLVEQLERICLLQFFEE